MRTDRRMIIAVARALNVEVDVDRTLREYRRSRRMAVWYMVHEFLTNLVPCVLLGGVTAIGGGFYFGSWTVAIVEFVIVAAAVAFGTPWRKEGGSC